MSQPAASSASSAAAAAQQAALPFLPGYRVQLQPKERHHKAHIFDLSNGIRVDVNQNKMEARAGSSSGVHPLSISSVPKDYRSSLDATHATPSATMSRLPAWVAYDRKVLRFSGYFKESVHASAAETWRVRDCVIYFYLEDNSMQCTEPKQENSGIPQGVFVKRHRIPKDGAAGAAGGGFYGVDDLFIGAELPIYGRVFRLTDCDAFTRAFYEQNGVTLAAPEAVPLDSFAKRQTQHVHSHHKQMNPLKTFMEARLGKPMHAGIEATQKFLQNDGKVLRFFAQWADDKLYGEIRPYIVHFFLADDTVSVDEVSIPNSGRDPFPSLLKRSRLPKNFHEVGVDQSRIGQSDDGKVQYYAPEDFRVGGYIQVYGRNLFLCGADDFTREWYKSNFGLSDADFPRLNMDEPESNPPSISPPPHNGFGSEEDSLASFLYLMPKVPKTDFKKLIMMDGVNLRFLAKFVAPSRVDANRRFIVTFYLSNDSLMVYEKFERNSGFVGGKFLERDRVKNPRTGEWYKAADLYVGARVQLNQFEFELIDVDEYSAKFIANNMHIWGENGRATAAKVQHTSAAAAGASGFAGESTQQIRETGATNEAQLQRQAEEIARSRPHSATSPLAQTMPRYQ